MTHFFKYSFRILFPFTLIVLMSLVQNQVQAQASVEDSLRKLIARDKADTDRVTHLWRLANVSNKHSPDSSLSIAQQALYLARRIKYEEGESRSLGVIANTLIKLGNYPKALEYYFEKLKLEEKRDKPRNLASVIMNIGVVYMYQQEYRRALEYYFKADSIIEAHNLTDIRYSSALNIGDLYDRLELSDSAYIFFNRSLQVASDSQDSLDMGTSMVGLGNNALKKEQYVRAKEYYMKAMPLLEKGEDHDIQCETWLGLAKLYQATNQNDSAIYSAQQSWKIALADGFTNRQLEAAQLLTTLYNTTKSIDSAFVFQSRSIVLSDSINSRNRIRELQMLSINEQVRQREQEEAKLKAAEERSKQLQYLFISIFIPFIFLFTFFLSKRKIHVRVIRFMGIISLLIFFEFLTLLLHPVVADFTHHNPIYELLIFVCIASLLIPTHHRIEHWVIHKLTHRHEDAAPQAIKLRTIHLKKKKPS